MYISNTWYSFVYMCVFILATCELDSLCNTYVCKVYPLNIRSTQMNNIIGGNHFGYKVKFQCTPYKNCNRVGFVLAGVAVGFVFALQ